MYRYLLALTANREDAEDLTQETFAAAVVGLAGFQGKSSVATWLLGIARRKWLMHVRKETHGPTAVGDLENAQPVPGPAGAVIAKDRVRRLLLQLPEAQASIVWLRVFEDLPLAEIAAVLGMSEASVKVGLFRAKRKLQKIIEGEESRCQTDSAR